MDKFISYSIGSSVYYFSPAIGKWYDSAFSKVSASFGNRLSSYFGIRTKTDKSYIGYYSNDAMSHILPGCFGMGRHR